MPPKLMAVERETSTRATLYPQPFVNRLMTIRLPPSTVSLFRETPDLAMSLVGFGPVGDVDNEDRSSPLRSLRSTTVPPVVKPLLGITPAGGDWVRSRLRHFFFFFHCCCCGCYCSIYYRCRGGRFR